LKAVHPIRFYSITLDQSNTDREFFRRDLVEGLGVGGLGITCGAVCVYPERLRAYSNKKIKC